MVQFKERQTQQIFNVIGSTLFKIHIVVTIFFPIAPYNLHIKFIVDLNPMILTKL